MQDKTKWSYLAALFDGEGHIGINRVGRKSPGQGWMDYGVRLVVVNTSLVLMKWLLKTFGGTYYLMNRNRREHWKPCFMWMPKGAKNKETLLLSVLPYMIIKREQAVLALEFVRLNGERNPAKRLALYNKAALLNSRVSPTTNMPDDSDLESKIESDLMGDHESELAVTQASQTQTDQTETAAPA